jgi:pimeloyl-ACP methyl ester carboxylesterase
MNTNTPTSETSARSRYTARRRGCLFYIKRGLKWLGIALIALVLLGVAYQTIATEIDKHTYAPRGQLYSVNGRQMHLVCVGEGSPAVVLQAGGVAESLWWYRIQNQLAGYTRVCALDRPGLGWSEPANGPREALTIVGELHALLQEAGVPAPYVMAGHSYGAILTRIYATQYPQEVAGIALIDSQILNPKRFASQSEFDAWKAQFEGAEALAGWLTRLGVTRLIAPGTFQQAGYPADIARELAALQSRNQVVDTDTAEKLAAVWALTEASAAAEDLGDLPMAVLWASQTIDGFDVIDAHAQGSQERYSALREEISAYSSNSVTRIVEGADHSSILGNEQYAQQVSEAVRDVIEAAQTGQPLTIHSIGADLIGARSLRSALAAAALSGAALVMTIDLPDRSNFQPMTLYPLS